MFFLLIPEEILSLRRFNKKENESEAFLNIQEAFFIVLHPTNITKAEKCISYASF